MNEPRNQLEIINLSQVTYFLLSIFNIVSSWARNRDTDDQSIAMSQ